MLIIGCDYHPSVQQIAWVDTETGETGERRLKHSDREAEGFYRELKEKGFSVRVGMEATGHARWFERLLGELGFELWVGDPGKIRAKQVKKQKNDRRDAEHLLKLLMKDDFPRLWVPTPENRDVRQLVLHLVVTALEQSSPARTAGAVRPFGPKHRAVEPSDRARS